MGMYRVTDREHTEFYWVFGIFDTLDSHESFVLLSSVADNSQVVLVSKNDFLHQTYGDMASRRWRIEEYPSDNPNRYRLFNTWNANTETSVKKFYEDYWATV